MSLVREFAATGSDAVFAALVERHINLVYSVALRRLGNSHEAEEVTQVVFIILAKKAGSLSPATILSGWLYQAAQLTSANAQRANIRRRHREQEAFMQFTQESESQSWPQLSPFLEDAMSRLRQKDRDAIVLRFFENRTVAEAALAMGLSEAAAQKRLNRATDKLRNFFSSRGIQVSTHGMLHSIGNHAVQIAPAGLASSIATVAATKGVAAGGSTLTLLKGALKIMAWTKAKTAVVTGTVILLAAGTTTVVVDKIVAMPPRVGNLSATDLSWADNPKYWATDSRVLEKIPSGVFILRPTRFPGGGGVWVNHRMCIKNQSVGDLVDNAYGFSYTRTVLPPDLPSSRFDLMATAPNSYTLLKDELKRRFGLTAHTETREVDVLLLKVQNPNPPNLKRRTLNGNSTWIGGNGKITIQNQGLGGFFSDIESRLGIPVIDETGLKGRYDLKLEWRQKWLGEFNKDAYRQALSEQLGLQLVPGRQPIKMLVVDHNNSL